MSEKKKNLNPKENADALAKKEEKTQTVYTHGKVFKIPASKNLEEFLREKYPEEYK